MPDSLKANTYGRAPLCQYTRDRYSIVEGEEELETRTQRNSIYAEQVFLLNRPCC